MVARGLIFGFRTIFLCCWLVDGNERGRELFVCKKADGVANLAEKSSEEGAATVHVSVLFDPDLCQTYAEGFPVQGSLLFLSYSPVRWKVC